LYETLFLNKKYKYGEAVNVRDCTYIFNV